MTAPPTANTPFYKACLLVFDGANWRAIPALPGARAAAPKNFALPPLLGNYWPLNYEEGFRQGVVDFTLYPLDLAEAAGSGGVTGYSVGGDVGIYSPLSTSFLKTNFISRTNDAANDSLYVGGAANGYGVIFWDGRTGKGFKNAKGDSFRISAEKGSDVRVICRFLTGDVDDLGTGVLSATGVVFNGWSPARCIRFQGIDFQSGTYNGTLFTETPTLDPIVDQVWGFDLTYSNQHTPHMGLNKKSFAPTHNAGQPMGRLSLINQAADGDFGIADQSAIELTIDDAFQGGSKLATFLMPRVLNDSRDNRETAIPRNMRRQDYVLTGYDAQTNGPLIMTSNF